MIDPGDPPDPEWQALFDSIVCGPDAPWADKVVYRPLLSDECRSESLGSLRMKCDAGRDEWESIRRDWKDGKVRYVYLCQNHAYGYGILW